MSRVYLIPVDRVKELSYIDTNVDDTLISKASYNTQVTIIEPLIGSKFYNLLCDGVIANNLSITNKSFITDYLWPILATGSEFLILKRLLLRLTNSSVVKDDNPNAKSVELFEVENLKSDTEELMKAYINKMQLYIRANSDLFPEYYEADADDIVSSVIEQNMLFYTEECDNINNYGPSNYQINK
jgi:hypothetical protein